MSTKPSTIAASLAGTLALALTCTGCAGTSSQSTQAATTAATTAAATRQEAETAPATTQAATTAQAQTTTQVTTDDNTVAGDGYTVEIPAYWEGKVTATQSGSEVRLCPTELPDYPLIVLAKESEPTEFAGDVGNSRVASMQLADGSYVEAWITRWAYVASLNESSIASMMGTSDPATIAGLSILVDLQTGGAYSYEAIAGNPSSVPDTSQADAFLNEQVVPTIKSA